MAIQEQYYCMVDNGEKPKYKHNSLFEAVVEAKRLKRTTNCKKVEVLKIVCIIEDEQIPVTKTETTIKFVPGYEDDDLPF
jgi:hypothetical protein